MCAWKIIEPSMILVGFYLGNLIYLSLKARVLENTIEQIASFFYANLKKKWTRHRILYRRTKTIRTNRIDKKSIFGYRGTVSLPDNTITNGEEKSVVCFHQTRASFIVSQSYNIDLPLLSRQHALNSHNFVKCRDKMSDSCIKNVYEFIICFVRMPAM